MKWFRGTRHLAREDGIGLIEVTVATGIMAIAVAGLAGAMTLGIGVVGLARQRSSASAVASERIERIRNTAFEQVAVRDDPAISCDEPCPSTDPSNPDFGVSSDKTQYTVAPGQQELLVVTANGAVRHIEDPIVIGSTELFAYQYVTWVDDPGIVGTQDYKRVTVVVTWRRSLRASVSSRITATTFVGTGNVIVPGATPTPGPTPTPSPTPSPTPTPTATTTPTPGACPAGTHTILSGAGASTGYTNSLTVQILLTAGTGCGTLTAELSNDGVTFTNVTSVTAGTPVTVTWSIPAGDGTKDVRARFRDASNNLSSVAQAQITLDQTRPTVPGNLRQTACSVTGNDRSVTLTWDASSDANLIGYRVYRSIDSGPFTLISTTTSLSASDTTPKTLDSVRYMVRAYDRAGNESLDSNVLTYTKVTGTSC